MRLYELKPTCSRNERERGGIGGSSDASLHAKTFAVDRSRIFVGSFNFDPRSARLNTEMGVVIESPALAAQLSDALDRLLPRNAYEVRLWPTASLEWIDGERRHQLRAGRGLAAAAVDRLPFDPADRVAALS